MPIVPLYGHQTLRNRLADATARGALPQSILFHGERGVGKQRLALWLAELLLCDAPRDGAACGTCASCRYSVGLTHPDLLWLFPRERLKESDPSLDQIRLDVAQGVQERVKASGLYAPPPGTDGLFVSGVRLLVQHAAVTPAVAHRKVFIVGEADRMVRQEGADEAANAFLKLLEEPPADTFIILTTSAPGALLQTIRSRVVAMRIAPLADADVGAFLDDPVVHEALQKSELPRGRDERIRIAAGAPGRLLTSTSTAAAAESARRLLEVALSGDRGRLFKGAMAQGVAGARGDFTDVLAALTAVLHDRARAAVADDDERAARNAARAVDVVEDSKRLAAGNVNPQLITAALLMKLTRTLAAP